MIKFFRRANYLVKLSWGDNDVSYLHVAAVLGLMIEVIKVRLGASPGVVEGDSHERRDRVTITQRLHGRVPYYDGVKHRLIPVRVLVSHRREDLV